MLKSNIKTGKKAPKSVNILGIDILSTNTADLLTGIKEKITHNVKFSILTPNPELVLMANKNSKLREIVNRADFTVPDGIALLSAEKFLNTSINKSDAFYLSRLLSIWFKCFYIYPFDRKKLNGDLSLIKGRELFMRLAKIAPENDWKVFLLGGMDNEAELTAKRLVKENPKLKIECAGGREVNINLSKDIVDKINKFSPDLLFVAFGAPKQEIWIHNNLQKLKVKGAMAVGGTFRYIAGMSPLPPEWMEKTGLEWLWRLITEPGRLPRIFNAVVVFPIEVIKSKLRL